MVASLTLPARRNPPNSSGTRSKALTVPEVACFRRLSRYAVLAEGFAGGTAEGVREWLLFCCDAIETGAKEARGISDAVA